MNDKTCIDCKHFYRHYTRTAKGRYEALFLGHCIKPRLKKRYVDSKACENWDNQVKKEQE